MLEITFCWRKRCSQAHRLSNSISTKYAAGERVKAKSILLLDHVPVYSSDNSDILKKLKNLFIVSNFEDLTMLRSINSSHASDAEEVFRSVFFIIKFYHNHYKRFFYS